MPPRFGFGTVRLSCVDMQRAIDAFFAAIEARRGGYIACTCMHGIVQAEADIKLRRILNASLLTLPDGMPTVWIGRAKGFRVGRVAAPDFLEAVMRDPRGRSVRHFFLGGSWQALAGIRARAGATVGARALAGTWAPPMRPAGASESQEVLERIAQAKPDVIWVGLGLPKQEYWMAHHAAYFPRTVLVGVGAAFDWFGGLQPRAPRWLQALGLEWAHRVWCEPSRLWPRYRAVVPGALAMMAREMYSSAWLRARASPPNR